MTSAYVVVHVDEEDALRVDSDPHGVVHLVEDQRFAWLLDLTAEKRRAEKINTDKMFTTCTALQL